LRAARFNEFIFTVLQLCKGQNDLVRLCHSMSSFRLSWGSLTKRLSLVFLFPARADNGSHGNGHNNDSAAYERIRARGFPCRKEHLYYTLKNSYGKVKLLVSSNDLIRHSLLRTCSGICLGERPLLPFLIRVDEP
jgi:hypothetical protein